VDGRNRRIAADIIGIRIAAILFIGASPRESGEIASKAIRAKRKRGAPSSAFSLARHARTSFEFGPSKNRTFIER
jgi:hypothetical protein